MRSLHVLVMAGALTALAPSVARAQATEEERSVSPTAKGVIGGALLGAEVVTLPMAIAGVKPAWTYLVFGGAGAVAGGVGGYFVERSVEDGRVPLYMLAGGLALILPTVVLTLNATRYNASDRYRENSAPESTPAEPTPGQTGRSPRRASQVARQERQQQAPTGSLVAVAQKQVQFSLPVPEVRPIFGAKQRAEFGVKQETEVRVPLVHVAF